MVESLFKEIMPENFPNLERHMEFQVHETQQFPNRLSQTGVAPRYSIIKLSKTKREFCNQQEIRLVTYKGTLLRLSKDFSEENLHARRE